MPFNVEELHRFPIDAGVYLMKNGEDKVIYVGKAKNIRQRVRQYFLRLDTRPLIPHLLAEIEFIDFIIVTSEKEALLLENNLIKKYQPKYNALLKDDKSYSSLMINHKHMWPMIRVVRYKKPPPGNLYFGPYTKALAARETFQLLQQLFPLRQCSDRELVRRTRPCILYDLKRCVAPCVAKCTKEEYDTLVKEVIDFLRGHDKTLLNHLNKEMEAASENLEFEKAALLFKKIQSIEATMEKQSVERAGFSDMDVLGLFRHLDDAVITQMQYREGKLIHSLDYYLPQTVQEDDEILSSFIVQHYEGKEFLPEAILIPIALEEKEALHTLLNNKTEIIQPKKGDKLALVQLSYKNAEGYFHRKKEQGYLIDKLLMTLEEKFHLTNYPEVIECIDNSNLSGSEPVSCSIVYREGEKDKSSYRKYLVKNSEASDDYGALKEVLIRRYRKAREEKYLPDLLLIDGGKGHLNVALNTLSELDISTVDLIAITKEKSKHTKGMTEEKFYTPFSDTAIQLPADSALLHFLQKIRDEAHRFAITFQKVRRKKKTLASVLDLIPGIGPIKKKKLLQHFGSPEGINRATDKQILDIQGITKKDLKNLRLKIKEKEL